MFSAVFIILPRHKTFSHHPLPTEMENKKIFFGNMLQPDYIKKGF